MRRSRLFCGTLTLFFASVLGFAQDYTGWQLPDYTRWHLPEGAIVRFERSWIGDFAFLPDGDRFAVSSGIGLWICDVHTGEELELFTDVGTKQRWNRMVLSPDGRTLAAATDHEVVLWDLQTNKLDNTQRMGRQVCFCMFS